MFVVPRSMLVAHFLIFGATSASADPTNWDGVGRPELDYTFELFLATAFVLGMSWAWWLGKVWGSKTPKTQSSHQRVRDVGTQCFGSDGDVTATDFGYGGGLAPTVAPKTYRSKEHSDHSVDEGEIYYTLTGKKYHVKRDCFHIRKNTSVISRQACCDCKQF